MFYHIINHQHVSIAFAIIVRVPLQQYKNIPGPGVA